MRYIITFIFLLLSFVLFSQDSFQIQNNKTNKIKSYKIGDKIIFKTQENDLVHTGNLDSVKKSSIIVSGAEIQFTEFRYLISERKWRKLTRPIAAVGVLTGFVWVWVGNLWTIAGVGGNQRYLLTGPANIIIGHTIKFISLLPFVICKGKFSIPDKWHVVGSTIHNTEEEFY